MSKQTTPDAFAQWVVREMPAGTEIGDPEWWAPRLWRAAEAARTEAPTPAPDAVTLPEEIEQALEAVRDAEFAAGRANCASVTEYRPFHNATLDAVRSLRAEIAAALHAFEPHDIAVQDALDQLDAAEARVRELEARDRQVAGQLVRHWHEHAEACAECEPLRRDPDYVCREWRPTLDALCPARQAGEVEND